MNLDLNKLLILCIFVSSSSQLFADDSFILNYEDVDIKKVTQDIAQFSKKTIILDPRVKGKITIYSNAELDRDQVWNVYLRTLQVNGFSIISEEGFVRIIPENEATRDLSIATKTLGDFETVVIPLTNRSADEILPMVKPITGRQAHLSSIPEGIVPGAQVEQGSIIGLSGNTGTSDGALKNDRGAHLHWEMHFDSANDRYFLGQNIPSNYLYNNIELLFDK